MSENKIIYVLTNPVMPDMVKIGKTENLEERVRTLSTHSGVPVPFEVHYACELLSNLDSDEVEKGLHDAFGDHRVNPRREFFRINPERVLAILKPMEMKNVTPGEDYVEDEEERQSLNREKARKTFFTFSSVNIPPGAVLHFVRDETVTATVRDDRNVEFEGELTSLSQSALKLLQGKYGSTAITCRGPDYWVYENETLTERRLRLESEE